MNSDDDEDVFPNPDTAIEYAGAAIHKKKGTLLMFSASIPALLQN